MKIIVTVVFIVLASMTVEAQDHCSLVVQVVDPTDHELEAQVMVRERNARILSAENEAGGVRFCDLGISPITVIVGRSTCNQVTVRDVPLQWSETKTVKIVYDIAPCLKFEVPKRVCDVLFRVSDQDDKWLLGVSLNSGDSGTKFSKSDGFGRILASIPLGTDMQARLERDGFVSEDVRFTCTQDTLTQERMIKLRRSL